MGTRCYIIKQNPDNSLVGTFCHSSGYLTGNGVGITLLKHYQTPEKIDRLFGRGDIGQLREYVGVYDESPKSKNQYGETVYFHARPSSLHLSKQALAKREHYAWKYVTSFTGTKRDDIVSPACHWHDVNDLIECINDPSDHRFDSWQSAYLYANHQWHWFYNVHGFTPYLTVAQAIARATTKEQSV